MGWDGGLPDARPAHPVWVDGFGLARTPVTNAEFGAFLHGQRRAAPAVLGRSAALGSRAAGRGRDLGRGRPLLRVAHPRERPPPPPPDRGGVGARRARRPGERPLSVGRRAAGPLVRGPGGTAARPAARGTGSGQRLRPDGSRRRRPRVVPRLVRRRRVRPGADPRADGSARGLSPRVARRRLAPPGAVEPGGPPLEPAAPPPLLGLRLPGGLRVPPSGRRRSGPRAPGAPDRADPDGRRPAVEAVRASRAQGTPGAERRDGHLDSPGAASTILDPCGSRRRQLADFHAEGFLVLPALFSRAEVERPARGAPAPARGGHAGQHPREGERRGPDRSWVFTSGTRPSPVSAAIPGSSSRRARSSAPTGSTSSRPRSTPRWRSPARPGSGTTTSRRTTPRTACPSRSPSTSTCSSTTSPSTTGPWSSSAARTGTGPVRTALDTETTSYALWTVDNETVARLARAGGLVTATGVAGTALDLRRLPGARVAAQHVALGSPHLLGHPQPDRQRPDALRPPGLQAPSGLHARSCRWPTTAS